MVGEFGGNDYNAPLFAGKGIPEAYKFMPDVIQGISDGVEVVPASNCCVLFVHCLLLGKVVPTAIVCVRCRH